MSGEDINVLSDKLGKALYRGELDKARELLDQGADINWHPKEIGYGAPVCLAVCSGIPASLKFAIEAGADINIRDNLDKTLLFDAVNAKMLKMAEILIDAGVDVNGINKKRSLAIHEAAVWGTSEIIRSLAGHGSHIDAINICGQTPLMLAASWNRSDHCRTLLELGAQVDLCDPNTKETALMLACSKGHETVVRILLDAGADVNSQNRVNITALNKVIITKKTFLVPVLLAAGADPNIPDRFGNTAVHSAAMIGQTGTIRKLVKAGGDIYKTDGSAPRPRNAIEILIWSYPKKAKLAYEIEELFKKTAGHRLALEDRSRATATGFEFDI